DGLLHTGGLRNEHYDQHPAGYERLSTPSTVPSGATVSAHACPPQTLFPGSRSSAGRHEGAALHPRPLPLGRAPVTVGAVRVLGWAPPRTLCPRSGRGGS